MALATQTTNPGTNGSNARYSTQGLRWDSGRGAYTDGVYFYNSDGLSYDRPDRHVPGLIAANELNGRDPTGAPISGGGGAAGGGGGGAGSSNPYFQQIKSILEAQGASDAANTRSAIQQALVSFGLVPEGFQDKLGALDDLTKSLIAKNTESGISSYARMLEARREDIRNRGTRLSARGLRRSGARGKGLRQGQLDFDRIFQDAISSLLGHTGGLYSGYANNEYNRQLSLASALANAFQNFGGGGGGGGGGGAWSPIPFGGATNTSAGNKQAIPGTAPQQQSSLYKQVLPFLNRGGGGGRQRVM